MTCLLLTPVSKTEERKGEQIERRESEIEEREDIADEERQGELTASQQSRKPPTTESKLLQQLKRQENLI